MKLWPHQIAPYRSDKRFIMCSGGVQSGKTVVIGLKFLNEIAKYPDDDFLIGAPSYKVLEQGTTRRLFELNPYLQNAYNKNDGIINKAKLGLGKGVIYCRSTEEIKAIESMTLRGAWLDESGQMADLVWERVNDRCAIKRGRIFSSTTQYDVIPKWIKDFEAEWKAGGKDYDCYFFDSIDNPLFPREVWDDQMLKLDEVTFARRYRGMLAKRTGLVWKDYSEKCLIYKLPEFTGKEDIIAGIDFVVDCYVKTNCLLKEHYNYVKENPVIRAYGDPTAKQEMAEIGAWHIIKLYNADNDVLAGCNTVTRLFREKRLFIYQPKCQFLIEEIENYIRDKDSEKPVKANDHSADSLRYCLHTEEGLYGEKYYKSPAPRPDKKPEHLSENEYLAWKSKNQKPKKDDDYEEETPVSCYHSVEGGDDF